MRLQSRGHYLNGGYRERHFNMLKTWGNVHGARLFGVLGARYIMYGEWMYAKHTVFYDQLTHYFMEFDVYDRKDGVFLSTSARRELLRGMPIMPVPVLFEGVIEAGFDVKTYVKPSQYKSANWRIALDRAAIQSGNKAGFVEKQTEFSDLAEGVYFKLEDAHVVHDRFKYVRADFVQTINASDGHWQSRPILPNGLIAGLDIFAPVLGLKGAYDEIV